MHDVLAQISASGEESQRKPRRRSQSTPRAVPSSAAEQADANRVDAEASSALSVPSGQNQLNEQAVSESSQINLDRFFESFARAGVQSQSSRRTSEASMRSENRVHFRDHDSVIPNELAREENSRNEAINSSGNTASSGLPGILCHGPRPMVPRIERAPNPGASMVCHQGSGYGTGVGHVESPIDRGVRGNHEIPRREQIHADPSVRRSFAEEIPIQSQIYEARQMRQRPYREPESARGYSPPRGMNREEHWRNVETQDRNLVATPYVNAIRNEGSQSRYDAFANRSPLIGRESSRIDRDGQRAIGLLGSRPYRSQPDYFGPGQINRHEPLYRQNEWPLQQGYQHGNQQNPYFPSPSYYGSVPIRKSVPVNQWRISFSGEEKSEVKTDLNIHDFLEQVEMFSRAENIPEPELLRQIVHLLHGRARAWYQNVYRQIFSWQQFIQAIKEKFLPLDNLFNLLLEMENRFHR